MGFGVFPEDHLKRQVIVLLDHVAISQCKRDLKGQEMLYSHNLFILEWPVKEQHPIARKIMEHQLDKKDAILIQSPFNKDAYLEMSECTIQDSALEKFQLFSGFCGKLGAREYSTILLQVKTASGKYDFDLSAGSHGINAGLGGELKNIEDFVSSIKLKETFSGSEPDIEGARQYLEEHSLIHDRKMRYLLDAREGKNKILNHESEIELSSEIVKGFNLALGVVAFDYVNAQIKAEYEKYSKTRYNITCRISF